MSVICIVIRYLSFFFFCSLSDVKPQILSFDDPPISPVAGTSHGSDRSLMMYMDQSGVASIPGPSNFQDNSALVPHDSQPQGNISSFCKLWFVFSFLYTFLWWKVKDNKLQCKYYLTLNYLTCCSFLSCFLIEFCFFCPESRLVSY